MPKIPNHAELPSADFIFEGDRIVGIDVGGANLLFFTNGIPGFGGLNPTFLAEEGWRFEGDTVEIIEPITRNRGKVKLPSGYEVCVTMRDIQPTWTEAWQRAVLTPALV